MRILFDTDVLLDVLMDREPFVEASAQLLSLVESSQIQGCVASTSVTTIFYLARKALGAKRARRAIADLLDLLDVAPVNRVVLNLALASRFNDFEDAVVAYAAFEIQADALATRNVKDFKSSPVTALSPVHLLAALATGDVDG